MISVLLPTYNSASIIGHSIKSILNQTFHDYELLILDDGSTDDTESIVSQFKDGRIRYLKYPHHGLSETLNAGLREAKCEIVARMDAGDLSLPERFEKQYYYLSKSPYNTIVSSRYAVFTRNKFQYIVSAPIDQNTIRKQLALFPAFAHSGVMYYRSFIIDNGMYRSIPMEDYDIWLRIKDLSVFHILDEVLLFVEYVEGRLSTQNVAQKYKFIYILQQPYYIDLQLHFGISDKCEENLYRGWREYFYGDKEKARKYWIKLGLTIFRQPRVILAWFVTYLPENIFLTFKEARIRFRLQYLLQYFSREYCNLRKVFAAIIKDGYK
jgi:glycosyltransferase involved in cell wall biosynthesis